MFIIKVKYKEDKDRKGIIFYKKNYVNDVNYFHGFFVKNINNGIRHFVKIYERDGETIAYWLTEHLAMRFKTYDVALKTLKEVKKLVPEEHKGWYDFSIEEISP